MRKYQFYRLLALCMALCMLFPCCVSAAHMAEHACRHYENCELCQQFDSIRCFSMLAMLILTGWIFVHDRIHLNGNAVRSRIVPVTLISQSIQMND